MASTVNPLPKPSFLGRDRSSNGRSGDKLGPVLGAERKFPQLAKRSPLPSQGVSNNLINLKSQEPLAYFDLLVNRAFYKAGKV